MFRWSLYPLLRPGLLFVIGILIGSQVYLDDPHFLTLIGGSFLLLSGLIISTRYQGQIRSKSWAIWILYILIGFGYAQAAFPERDHSHYTRYIEDTTQTILVELEEDVYTKGATKAFAHVRAIDKNPCRGKTVVYFHKKDTISYKHGSVLALQARVSDIRKNTNPYVFDYKNYLKNRHISHQVRVQQSGHVLLIEDNLPLVYSYARRMRTWALDRLETIVPSVDHRAIANAMILGYKKNLSEELYTAYSETGAIHVLAVSGLHVGVICMLFVFLFKRIASTHWSIRVAKIAVLLSIVWMYCLITGAAPAVVRASVMFSLLVIGKEISGSTNIYNILMASAILILAYDPYLIFQASFQFSYLALVSIVFFHNKIMAPFLTPWKIPNYFIGLIVVSIAAQILVFPVTTYYFHKFPIYFILSGIVAVPMAFLILTIGITSILLYSIPYIGCALAWILNGLLWVFEYLINFIHKLPYASINGIWYEPAETLLIYLCLILGMISLYTKYRVRYYMSLLAVAILATSYSISIDIRKNQDASILVYDMGRHASLMDIKDKKAMYSWNSADLPERSISFNASNYRLRMGASDPAPLPQQDGAFQIENKVIRFIHKASISRSVQKVHTLIVLNKNTMDPVDLTNADTLKEVIVDATIKPWHQEKWKSFCARNKIKYHSVSTDGAYYMPL